jgi:hypothetical protein
VAGPSRIPTLTGPGRVCFVARFGPSPGLVALGAGPGRRRLRRTWPIPGDEVGQLRFRESRGGSHQVTVYASMGYQPPKRNLRSRLYRRRRILSECLSLTTTASPNPFSASVSGAEWGTGQVTSGKKDSL